MRDTSFQPLARGNLPAPFDPREPRIDAKRTGGPAGSFVRLIRRGLSVLVERREPHLDLHPAIEPDTRLIRHAALSDWPKRNSKWLIGFAAISLLLHIAFFAAVRLRLFGLGDGDTPIPVQLVLEQPQERPPDPPPPQPPPPQPKQEQQQQKPPPRGPLASDELGDPDATGRTPTPTRAPAAGEVQRKEGEAPPPPSSAPAAAKPNPTARQKPTNDPFRSDSPEELNVPTTREQLAAAGQQAPPPSHDGPVDEFSVPSSTRPSPVRLMAPTPPGGARRPTDRRDDPDHAEGHKAKYPGPDASRDEYLAYLVTLTNAQLRSLPPQLSQVRDGAALYEVLIRPNGSIVWFSLIKSSGHPDVDSAVTATLNGIQAFPPLPNELLEPGGGPIKLTYTMPLARLADLISGR